MSENKLDIDLDRELKLLEQELEENSRIYTQVKDHYDRVINSRSASTFKFITDQTGNVLKVRSDRLGIVKEMINVKKLKAELTIKEMNMNKDANGNNDQVQKMAKELYNMMKSDNRAGNIANLLNKNARYDDEVNEETEAKKATEELNNESALEERMREIKAKKEKEEREKQIKERGYIFACDLDKNIYAINETGTEIIEGVDLPDFEIEFEVDDLTGLTIAKNQYGDVIEIISVE